MNHFNSEKLEDLILIISTALNIDSKELNIKSGPEDYIQWDSLANVTIYAEIASKINPNISLSEYLNCKEIGDIVEII